MSYEFYKILHLLGIMILFFGFGGLLVAAYSQVQLKKAARTMAIALHGLGLFLILLGGFGMAARLGMVGQLPTWIYIKLAIWLLLGGAVAIIKRKGHIGWPIAILVIGFGITAAIVAITKPI